MGHHFVVGRDIELDEATKTDEAVERMKVEPRVLQGSPECLDHRIRERDLDLSQDPRQTLAVQQFVYGSVDVLASRVCHHDGMSRAVAQLNGRFAQDATRPAAPEPFLKTPRQDSPGKVVDHSMQIRSRPVEQPDDCYIQVEEFAGSVGAYADLGFDRIDTLSGSSPAAGADLPIPGRWRSQDLPDSLSVKSQRSQRHVSVIVALDHLAHGVDLIGSQACRDDARTACLIIKVTSGLGTTPIVVAGCRETRDSKRGVEWHDVSRPCDRSQEDALGVAVREALVFELDLRCSKHRDQKTDDRSEQSGSASEFFDLRGQRGTITAGEIAGDHVRRAAVNPASNGRTGDVQLRK